MKYNKERLVKYNLKKTNKDNLSQIILIMNFNGIRLRYYTGKRITNEHWDKLKQRANLHHPHEETFNQYLESLSCALENYFHKLKLLGEIPTIQKFKSFLDNYQNKKNQKNFLERFHDFIEFIKNEKATNTIKKYKSTLKQLEKFKERKNFEITYHAIDKNFENNFKDYLENDLGLVNNSIAKYIQTIKTFMNWSVEKGYTDNTEYKNFTFEQNKGELYYLNWNELLKLYYLKLNKPRFEKIKDIFCFGCFTGLKFSEIMILRHEDIIDNMIHPFSLNNKTQNVIPLNRYSKEIYEKYKKESGLVFDSVSNQKMNEYLKELGKIAHINEPVDMVKHKGPVRVEVSVPKYKVLTTQVARQTFIKNAIEKGMRTEVLLNITNNKDHRSLDKYYEIINEQKKEEMIKVFGE